MSYLRRFTPLAALLVALTCGSLAQATLNDGIVTDGRLHGLQDTDADVALRVNMAGTWSVHSGALAVGDVLAAGVGWDTLERLGLSDHPMTGVNGFNMLKVASVSPPGGPFGLVTLTFTAPTVAEWSKIVDDIFGGTGALKKTTAGGLVIVYDDANEDFDRIAPPATLAGSAATLHTGGTTVSEIGFTGAVDGFGNVTPGAGEGWLAVGPSTPSLAFTTPLNTVLPGTSFTLAVNALTPFFGLNFLPLLNPVFGGPGADFVGGGTLSGYGDGMMVPSAVGPWHIGSDADISFRPVPEPGSILCWTGIAALGFVVARRRRARKAS